MVMISTDKAVNPTNVMGGVETFGRDICAEFGTGDGTRRDQGKTRFVTTRFGNVLGSNGSVIPYFRNK